MSFLAPKTTLPEQDGQIMSYESTGPVPVVLGRAPVRLKLLDSLWNHQERDHGKTKAKGHMYSMVMAGCHGPVDRLYRLWINNEIWTPFSAVRGAADYTDMAHDWNTAADSPRVRIYWGTQTQQPDPFLNGAAMHGKQPPRNPDGSARTHPAYTGIFYIVFYNWHFDMPNTPGSGNTSLPEIIADVFVRPPLDTGSRVDNRGSNPIAITREILRNPVWGGGVDEAALPEADWQSKAWDINDNGYYGLTGGEGHLSLKLSQTQDLAEHLANHMAYYDGYIQQRGGKMYPGYFPNQQVALGSVTTISRQDLLDEPDVDPGSWDDTVSEVTAKYRVPADKWGTEAVTERSTYNLQVTGQPKKETIDCASIIDSKPARAQASRRLARRQQPFISARLRMLRSKAVNPDGSLLRPGHLVYVNYSQYDLLLLCRITEREDADGVTLTVTAEPGNWPENYVAEDDNREIPRIEPPGQIVDWRLWELPAEMAGRIGPPKVAILARRPHAGVVGADVYIDTDSAFSGEEELAPLELFGTVATLASAVSDADDVIDIAGLIATDLPNELQRSYTQTEEKNVYMMAIVGDEVMSLGALSGDPGLEHGYQVTRGAMHTTPIAHAAGTEVWLMRRSDFERVLYEHDLFEWEFDWGAPSYSVYFRLAAKTGFEVGAPNIEKSLTMRDNRATGIAITSRQATLGGLQLTATWNAENGGGRLLFRYWRSDTGDEFAKWHEVAFADELATIAFEHKTAGQYRLQVFREIDIDGQAQRSAALDYMDGGTIEVFADGKAPADVTSLTAGAVDDRSRTAELTWVDPADDDLDRLHIYQAVTIGTDDLSGVSWTLIDSVEPGIERFTVSHLHASDQYHKYWWMVVPVDKGDNLSQDPLPATTPTLPHPGLVQIDMPVEVVPVPVPTGTPLAYDSSTNRLMVRWDASGATADQHEVHIFATSDPSKSMIMSFDPGSAASEEVYFEPTWSGDTAVKVRGVDADGRYSVPVTFGTIEIIAVPRPTYNGFISLNLSTVWNGGEDPMLQVTFDNPGAGLYTWIQVWRVGFADYSSIEVPPDGGSAADLKAEFGRLPPGEYVARAVHYRKAPPVYGAQTYESTAHTFGLGAPNISAVSSPDRNELSVTVASSFSCWVQIGTDNDVTYDGWIRPEDTGIKFENVLRGNYWVRAIAVGTNGLRSPNAYDAGPYLVQGSGSKRGSLRNNYSVFSATPLSGGGILIGEDDNDDFGALIGTDTHYLRITGDGSFSELVFGPARLDNDELTFSNWSTQNFSLISGPNTLDGARTTWNDPDNGRGIEAGAYVKGGDNSVNTQGLSLYANNGSGTTGEVRLTAFSLAPLVEASIEIAKTVSGVTQTARYTETGVERLSGSTTLTFEGKADSADKLVTPRTIALIGAVTGSGNFDGSGNLTISTTSAAAAPNNSSISIGTGTGLA